MSLPRRVPRWDPVHTAGGLLLRNTTVTEQRLRDQSLGTESGWERWDTGLLGCTPEGAHRQAEGREKLRPQNPSQLADLEEVA